MTALTTIQAREQFAELINRAAYGKERIVLTRRGRRLVAVVPVEDLQLLEALEDREDIARAREALGEARAKGTVSWEKITADLEL